MSIALPAFQGFMKPAGAAGGTLVSLTDLVAHWKLNESSGTRNDSHGTNHLTSNNSVASDTGKIGDAAKFTRASETWLSVADNNAVSMGDIDFTIAAWIYIDALSVGNPQDCISKWEFWIGSEEYLVRFNSSNKFEFFVCSSGGTVTSVQSTTAISAATWYFVLCEHDSVNNLITISVNNGTAQTASHSAGVRNGTSALEIGRLTHSATTALLGGRVDSVTLAKRLFNGTEKTNLFDGGNGLDYPF